MILQDFYTILQSAIGKTVQLSHTLSEKEWNGIESRHGGYVIQCLFGVPQQDKRIDEG